MNFLEASELRLPLILHLTQIYIELFSRSLSFLRLPWTPSFRFSCWHTTRDSARSCPKKLTIFIPNNTTYTYIISTRMTGCIDVNFYLILRRLTLELDMFAPRSLFILILHPFPVLQQSRYHSIKPSHIHDFPILHPWIMIEP